VRLAAKEPTLSGEDSFILCDSNSPGYPIRYVSEGFKALYGFSAAECAGKTCGELVGGGSILREGRAELLEAAEHADLTGEQALEAIDLITSEVAAYVKQESKTGLALAMNRRRSGNLFVCEMEVRRKKHPLLGWSFEAGVQRDISADISVPDLLTAATKGELEMLRASRRKKTSLTSLLEGARPTEFLYECASQMWRESVASTTRSTKLNLRMKAEEAAEDSRSLSSLSTACSLAQVSGQHKRKKSPSEAKFGPDATSTAKFGPDATSTVCSPGGHHLGGLLGAVQDAQAASRFLDLLEEVPAGSDEAAGEPVWRSSLARIDFPFVIADPAEKRCPLRGWSQSFLDLTGLETKQALGRNLLSTDSGLLAEAKKAYTALSHAAHQGKFCQKGNLLFGVEHEMRIADGELAFVDRGQEAVVFLKQVELDDRMLIIGVLEPFSEAQVAATFDTLGKHLDAAVKILASDFFYSAPPRRQVAETVG